MRTQDFDIIVVGAGVAGGIFAASQPESKKILVIERDWSEPDRIVGELMQPGGVLALQSLKLEHLLEGIDAQNVKGYKIIKDNQQFTIDYHKIAPGIKGVGLRNGKFLTNIRNLLKSRENITTIEGNVTQLIEDNNKITGVGYTLEDGKEITALGSLTVVCDGPMSLLRDRLSKPNKKVMSYFIGLILKDVKLENPFHGHMIVSGKAPILVYPVYKGAYRILIDYPGDKPPRLGKKSREDFKNSIEKSLPDELKEAFARAIDEGDLKVMPNHAMNGQIYRKDGAVLVGDALNMRHPLTGGGMTAVFSDIICLNSYLNGITNKKENDLSTAINNYYEKRRYGVETINILANALYEVFMNKELKEEVFGYLQKDGAQSIVPLSILSGINKDKHLLVKHFFAIAKQHPLDFLIHPLKKIRIYNNARKIIRPILKEEETAVLIK